MTPSSGSLATPIIRLRRPDDIPPLIHLLADVHDMNAYPLRWPANPREWLTPATALASWVASDGDVVLGNVTLSRVRNEAASAPWSRASGLAPNCLAEVGKLFVAIGARGQGFGAALLTTATDEARTLGLLPVLDVLDNNGAAIALYERLGWRRVATVPVSWAQGRATRPLLHYYIAP